MIAYITGIPGSGKTAKAVAHKIENKDNDKYEIIYSNVNQFDFEKIEKSKPLDWDILYASLKELHAWYKQKVTDDELIEYAKQHNLYKVLIVIDECHNYLDNKDKVLVWWLSYHRHLHQDIFLITQNLSLVESKYKAFAEVFYKASPSYLRFRHHILKYNKYIDSRMTQKGKFGVEKIDTKKIKVFDYYKSGDDSKGGNIILKFILIGAFFFAIILFLANYFFGDKLPQSKEGTNDNTTIETTYQKRNIPQIKQKFIKDEKENKYKNYKYQNFTCIGSFCNLFDKTIPINMLPVLSQMTDSTFFPLDENSKTARFRGVVLASPDLINLFRSVQNEKDNNRDSRSNLDLPLINR